MNKDNINLKTIDTKVFLGGIFIVLVLILCVELAKFNMILDVRRKIMCIDYTVNSLDKEVQSLSEDVLRIESNTSYIYSEVLNIESNTSNIY